jgi:hypothetical protein
VRDCGEKGGHGDGCGVGCSLEGLRGGGLVAGMEGGLGKVFEVCVECGGGVILNKAPVSA